ncbi:MAG: FkbM family methyltransferase [Actinomycetota bacterium]
MGKSTDVKAPIPKPPLPLRAMTVAKRILPHPVYYRYLGRHERTSMALWGALVDRAPGGAVILDVGAYHGVYAEAARQRRADVAVIAFEPNADALEKLRPTCADLEIAVEELALARATGSVAFSLDGESSGIVDHDNARERIEVGAVSLDDWADANGADPWLLKIDVEGSEDDVLTGGRMTMERARPIVLCEVLDDAAGRRVEQALPDDYCYFSIDEDRGPRRESSIRRWAWRHKNQLLVPSESVGMVEEAAAAA